MKENKSGFTLSEVLLVLVIVGVIMALSVTTFKAMKSSYTPLSYFLQKNVDMIVRTLFLGDYAKENTMLCKKSDGNVISVLVPDGVSPSDEIPLCSQLHANGSSGGGNKVCTSILSIVNVSGVTACSSLYSVSYDNNNNKEPYVSGITESKNPTFITTNGQRYYLSGSTFNAAISTEMGFRVLAVDLNGSRRPNSYDASNPAPPDIVNFLIMDNGDVYPLGVLADNIKAKEKNSEKVRLVRYIAANVNGYCKRGINKSDCESVISSTAHVPPNCIIQGQPDKSRCGFVDKSLTLMTFRQAYCATHGLNSSNGSMSYNGYCAPIIAECSADSTLEYCNYMFRCPPSGYSGHYDSCRLENIKPIFRFNFD